jgi:hypothetical protein
VGVVGEWTGGGVDWCEWVGVYVRGVVRLDGIRLTSAPQPRPSTVLLVSIRSVYISHTDVQIQIQKQKQSSSISTASTDLHIE